MPSWLDDDEPPKKKGVVKKTSGAKKPVPVVDVDDTPAHMRGLVNMLGTPAPTQVGPEGDLTKQEVIEKDQFLKKATGVVPHFHIPYEGMASASPQEKLAYIAEHWKVYNKLHFSGRLKPCRFALSKNVSLDRFKKRGYWNRTKNLMYISIHAFGPLTPADVDATIKHEMAHQWVGQEIGKVKDAHGWEWQDVMWKIGEKALKYDATPTSDYDPEGKTATNKVLMQLQLKEFRASHQQIYLFQEGAPCVVLFTDAKANAIDPRPGVLLKQRKHTWLVRYAIWKTNKDPLVKQFAMWAEQWCNSVYISEPNRQDLVQYREVFAKGKSPNVAGQKGNLATARTNIQARLRVAAKSFQDVNTLIRKARLLLGYMMKPQGDAQVILQGSQRLTDRDEFEKRLDDTGFQRMKGVYFHAQYRLKAEIQKNARGFLLTLQST